MRTARVVALLVACGCGVGARLRAQISFTLSGAPSTFPAPTAADYTSGFVTNPTALGWTVGVTFGGAANITHTSIVSVHASSATLGGSKPVTDLQWQRAGTATWTSVTTTDVAIESKQIQKKKINDPWSDSITLRMALAWASDTANTTYSTNLVFTLTITTP